MKDRRVFISLSTAGLLTLCHCSIVFSVNGLEDGGPDAAGSDATSNQGGGPSGGAISPPAEASVEDSAPSEATDDAALEAAGDGSGADDGSGDAQSASDDGSGAIDATGNAAGVDASGGAGSDAGALDATGSPGVLDAAVDSPGEAALHDAPEATGSDTGAPDAADAETVFDATGLVAYYQFDEASGDTSADSSGNGHTAQMVGATFSPGLEGNAATMNGMQEYVALPAGIVSGLTSFSVSAWFYLSEPTFSARIFDFGQDTTTYMFLTPDLMRFAITTSGFNGEEDLDGPSGVTTLAWEHVVVTLTGDTGTLYVNGAAVTTNAGISLNPSSLGSTPSNWLGRSEYPSDPYLSGQIDNFRIYSRALSAAEVQALFMMKL